MAYMFLLLSSHLQALKKYRSNEKLLIGSVLSSHLQALKEYRSN